MDNNNYSKTEKKMNKLSLKIKNRIGMLKASGKKVGKDYFITDNGDLLIKKRDYNEIVIGN